MLYQYHSRGQGQVFTPANMLITSPVGNVVKCSLWRPNILPLFNLGSWYLWLQHSVAAVLLFLKQPHNKI